RFLSYNELMTLFCEAEAIVNSRPLTYIGEDPSSLQVLRPIDFLSPFGYVETPMLNEDQEDDEWLPRLTSRQKLLRYWQDTQHCLDKFWDTFNSLYLQSLFDRLISSHPNDATMANLTPKEGEVTLLVDHDQPRSTWRLARIERLRYSNDGTVRSADVQLPNKKTLTRPINLLCPLEVPDKSALPPPPTSDTAQTVRPTPTSPAAVLEPKKPSPPLRRSLRLQLKRQTQVTPLWLSFMLLCFCMPFVMGNTCDDVQDGSGDDGNPTTSLLTPIRSSACVSTGYVVYRSTNLSLCWKSMTCPRRPHLDGRGQCRSHCKCPAWATECSQLPASAIAALQPPAALQRQVFDDDAPNVCSYTPSRDC
ncbi:MAG: hypothetical protein GY739_01665, partial [Mesoflavibacter sp.]|nr:hypothetical protein [Mesoflavibacter sp.]